MSQATQATQIRILRPKLLNLSLSPSAISPDSPSTTFTSTFSGVTGIVTAVNGAIIVFYDNDGVQRMSSNYARTSIHSQTQSLGDVLTTAGQWTISQGERHIANAKAGSGRYPKARDTLPTQGGQWTISQGKRHIANTKVWAAAELFEMGMPNANGAADEHVRTLPRPKGLTPAPRC